MKSILRSDFSNTNFREPFGLRICLEFLVVFCATLQGYYFYNVNVAPFPLVGFGILLMLCLHAGTRVLDRDSFYLILVVLILAAAVIVGTFNVGGETSWRNTVGSFVGPLFALAFVSYFRGRTGALIRCLKATLFVHIAAATTQFICYYGFGFYPDFLEPVTGEIQRYVGTGDLTTLARPTGLFPEPAHHALFVIVLIFILSRFRARLTTFQVFALVTATANFSLLGAGLTATFLVFYWFSSSRDLLMKLATITLAAIALIYGSAIVENASRRVDNIQSDTSFNDRYTASIGYFDSLPTSTKFLGTGIGIRDDTSYGSAYSYFLIHLGLILTFTLFACGLRYLRTVCRTNLLAIGYLAVLFLSTLIPTYLVFWMLIASIGVLERESGSHKLSERRPDRHTTWRAIDADPLVSRQSPATSRRLLF